MIQAVTTKNPERAQFVRDIDALNLMPLWERTVGLKPGTKCVPAMWRYEEVKPYLLRASKLITKKEAERRVLVLENPSLRGSTFITNSLYAGLQIILPGEVAPSHRHTPNALRFIVEGSGAYTAVEGEKIPMHVGDVIATPNWTWHDHGHEGSAPVVWMDGLDTPFTNFFGATFREDHPQEKQPVTLAGGHSLAMFGAGMAPVVHRGATCPLLQWPYERSREALLHLVRHGAPHAAHGFRLRYANPATGQHPFPTMAVFLTCLPKGFEGRRARTTDGTVFNVVEGSARVEIGKERYTVGVHDTFVVPPWEPFRLAAGEDCMLFNYSDRAAQETLGFWRESAE